MKLSEFDIDLFLVAEAVCDQVMGPGTYERLNGFSPAKGEFPMQLEIRCVEMSIIERMPKIGARYKAILPCGCYKFFTDAQVRRDQIFIGKRISHQGFQV